MLINLTKNFIFFHNPKAGGRFVRRWLRHSCEGDDCRHYWGVSRETGIDMAHVHQGNAAQVVEMDISGMCKIGIVRDPYDRLFSAYRQAKRSNCRGYLRRHRLSRFPTFLDHLDADPSRALDLQIPWFQPQHMFVCQDDRINVDILIRFESLAKGVEQIASRFSIRYPVGIDPKKLQPRPIRSQKHKRVCEKVYSKDFSLLEFNLRS